MIGDGDPGCEHGVEVFRDQVRRCPCGIGLDIQPGKAQVRQDGLESADFSDFAAGGEVGGAASGFGWDFLRFAMRRKGFYLL